MNEGTSALKFLALRLGVFVAAVLVAYLFASVTATLSVADSLRGMGVDVPLARTAAMMLHDLKGMASMFLPMIAFALLVAFMIAALLCRWLTRGRVILYVVAGATALVSIHLTLHLAFAITPVAIARTGWGLLAQGAAGGLGGATYLYLTRRMRAAYPTVPQPGTKRPVQ
ncbi:MAG: hypothetical protein PVJ33_01295 [Lysobacterales bacterium]|jgi:hypothetical protein